VQNRVYFDHNATTPVHPEILSKVPEWLECWGNASSIHWGGRQPKALLREARANIAKVMGVQPLELIFTAGGSEANNLALKGLAFSRLASTRKHIIISNVEHPSVRKAAEFLRQIGFKLDYVNADREGRMDLDSLREMVSEQTLFVSVMLANNETGHIYPLKEISEIVHARGAILHCDSTQALGKVPFNLKELGVDMATISGHKFYALKGAGCLFVRKGLNIESLVHGGGQERGRRAGTENTMAIASLGLMCGKADEIGSQADRIRDLRDHMEARILKEIEGVTVNGPKGLRLPNTSSLCIEGVDGETLLMNLDVRGFAVSTGAACSSGNPEPSPTLLAIGLSREEAQSSLRLSLGWGNTREEVDSFVGELIAVVGRLRGFKHGAKYVSGV
jgi:cysteine desulfurase